jgi:hypothetical protein
LVPIKGNTWEGGGGGLNGFVNIFRFSDGTSFSAVGTGGMVLKKSKEWIGRT